MRPKRPAFAALTLKLDRSGAAVQLLPAGQFQAVDGRPGTEAPCTHWVCGPEQAAAIIARANARTNDMVIDYEHQTLNAEKNGQAAPAAGWFKQMEWRDGEGLFAPAVKWTANAAAALDADEYRYISPVFAYDPQTGEVLQMHMAALTNNPGLDGMLPAALSARFFSTPDEDVQMNELLKALLAALGLPEGTDEQAALTALNAHLAKAQSANDQVAALTAERANLTAQVTALAASRNPDPSQYVPIQAVQTLQGEMAALSAQWASREADEVVQAALASGQLLPPMESWARDLAKSNLAALKSYISTAPKVAALTSTQTNGNPPGDPVPAGAEGLNAATLAVCRMMGTDPVAVAKTMGAQK
ncbi:phage protease [Chromobacterium vaccinii]|uniref:phage protease n=1 Tax=Chromobacterium vaccinii TaxID=1108595 RepID=UPI003C7943A5